MRILCITYEQSKLKDKNVLDWLCSPETKGTNHERYWLIRVDQEVISSIEDYNVTLINHLLWLSKAKNYDLIMIHKLGYEYKNQQPSSSDETPR
jgi:hypothetical protein